MLPSVYHFFRTVVAVALLPICLCGVAQAQSIRINEFMASNSTILADNAGDYEDWVELYNPAAQPIDIGGWYVTDDLANPTKYQLPITAPDQTTIPPQGYLLLWFDNEVSEGVLHVNTKLSTSGEAIGLYTPDLQVVDTHTFGVQLENISSGRTPNGGDNWDFFVQPTPQAANTTAPGAPLATPPTASEPSRKFSTPFSLTLSTAQANAQIYYTLDGNTPTANSLPYTTPISITATTIVRAVAIAPVPLLPSPVRTYAYFYNPAHTFPIVSLVFDSTAFFGDNPGIYTNADVDDLEAPAYIEFFETDDSLTAFSQGVGVEISGTGSAALPQKSLEIKAKAAYGATTIPYKIFPDLPFENYKRLVLRNSGQDWNTTMFRDAFVSGTLRDIEDVAAKIQRPHLYLQDYRPSVVYFNGQYWGIHNMRERMNRFYVEQHFGLAPNQYDFIENYNEVSSGDTIQWFDFQAALAARDLTQPENKAWLEQQVDMPHFIDYNAFNVYIDNADWPSNNNRRWRARTPEAKWRFLSFDLDFSFGLFQHNGGWNTGDATPNSLARLMDAQSILWPNENWSTLLFRKAMDNTELRHQFVNRMADMMNIYFAPARLEQQIAAYKDLYAPEIAQQFNRWWGFYSSALWEANIQKLNDFAVNRPAVMRTHLDAQFEDVGAAVPFTVTANPVQGGTIHVNTVTVQTADFPWTGHYFKDVPVPVQAVAAPGFVFTGWSDSHYGVSDSIQVTLSEAHTLVANFVPISDACVLEAQVSEVNCLPNDTEDESDDRFAFTLTVSAIGNHSAGWRTYIGDNAYLGTYGTPLRISGISTQQGALSFSIFDQTNENCGISVSMTPPAPCSPVPILLDLQPVQPTAESVVAIGAASAMTLQVRNTGNTPLLFPIEAHIYLSANAELDENDLLVGNANLPPQAVQNSALQSIAYTVPPDVAPGAYYLIIFVDATQVVTETQEGNNWVSVPIYITPTVESPSADYCDVVSAFPWHEWISSIQIGDTEHSSHKSVYSDFTATRFAVYTGAETAFSAAGSFSWSNYPQAIKVWIDYNQNGVWEEPAEIATQGTVAAEADGTPTVLFNATIVVPNDALPGITRMRVSMQRDVLPAPCTDISYGEIEDYSVLILPPTLQRRLPLATPALKVFPNPAQDYALVRFQPTQRPSQPVTLTLINQLGQVCQRIVAAHTDEDILLDCSDLPNGLYFLQIAEQDFRYPVQPIFIAH